ncbi:MULTISPECIES: hypothetical protein [unclassified Streptomyces]|uniref:hypothetical protein n=1 Tax=unclassified Streptomyces TaxID=2593676 RepID=UPI00336AC42A
MTAPESLSLPASINCVLARRAPATLALDLASAHSDLCELVDAIGDSRTYKNDKRNADARRQAKRLARRLRRISHGLYTGPCTRIRADDRLGRFVSAHDRDTLGDGGLAIAGRTVTRIARTISKLSNPEPFAVLVRDRSMSNTSSRMREVGQSLQIALSTVVLDLSAADLSGLEPHDVLRLHNVIWASGTIWPPAVAEQVRARSHTEVCPGVFLI